MLQNLAWHATDKLTRAQLALLHALGDKIGLTDNDRRRRLHLSEPAWQAWTDFCADGPLPAEPPLPEMLQRLGEVIFALARMVEGRDGAHP